MRYRGKASFILVFLCFLMQEVSWVEIFVCRTLYRVSGKQFSSSQLALPHYARIKRESDCDEPHGIEHSAYVSEILFEELL